MHYLDNAATTKVDLQVADHIRKVMEQAFANPSSLYKPGLDSELILRQSRAKVASAMGCTPAEVYFTGCGTESNNIAILGAVEARKEWADHIICTGYEHPSVQQPIEKLQQQGWKVTLVTPNEQGVIQPEQLADLVTSKTALVTAMQVNNETGAILDVQKLSKLAKEKNARTFVHVDGVQGWLRLPIKLSATQIDSYAVSGHKIHAPKGIGALYLKKNSNIIPPFLGGGQEKGIRPGTENLPYIAGLAMAAEMMQKNMPQRKKQIAHCNELLRSQLENMDGIVLNSPQNAAPEVLNFSVMGIRSETMLHFLEQKEVYVSSGSACSKGAASHTLAAMGLPSQRIDSALRVSFSKDSTQEDVQALMEGLAEGMASLARVK